MSSSAIGIYIHLPLCRARCTYCAFAISTDQKRQQQYHRALLNEIRGSVFLGSSADTLYLGGGTPSLSDAGRLAEVMDALRSGFRLSNDAEITIEANPEDVTDAAVARWCAKLGVNRISLGIQSFHDAELYPLGRGHSAGIARSAISTALRSPARVSLDLILGLPGQTSRSFEESLQTAIESGVGHLSLYMLDLEPGSALESQVRSGRVELPEDAEVAEWYARALETTAKGGLRQYEISNFALPGEQSRHNLKYWTREPYVGFGLGAHSFDGTHRWANTRDLDRYVAMPGSPVVFRETLNQSDRTREVIFLGLRQARGLRYSELLALRGEEACEWVSRGLSEGWLHSEHDRVAFTGSGFLLSNEYISQLF